MTNVEIEDVLASIRRLVSEDSRPETAPQDVPGKLVLTPALRISDAPEATESEPCAGSAAGDDTVSAVEPGGHYIPDDDYAEDTEEPQPLESADLEARFADMVEEEELDDLAESGPAEPEFGAAAAQEADLQAVAEDAASADWEEAETVEESASAYTASDAAYGGFEVNEVEEAPVEDPIEAVEFRHAAHADTDLEDLAEFDAEEEGILDEETLREMVTDIVRQELQGALGERITRNVRKLVRREIHRALTSHDLQ
ncbi:hypothetical protein [Thalassovita aquimarina]|uniref:hypothetical protein n=1 Tax=Thalassovita aquimarina TaxID=2785917 RepID=UPI001BAFE49E|nr:hypothetical protein [Thalassovita aquimarina]